MIELFLNENSFNDQFENNHEFKEGINFLIDLMQAVSEIKDDNRLTLFNQVFYGYPLLNGSRFDSLIKADNDLNSRFDLNLQALSVQSWKKDRKHSNQDIYECLDEVCTDSSVAEIAERKKSQNAYLGILLNVMKSKFGDLEEVDVIKNSNISAPVSVSCSFDRQSLYNWLFNIGHLLPNVRKFEHHERKHDRKKPKPRGASELKCTEQEAQQLLDNAVYFKTPFDKRLYNYDKKNSNMIVIFNRHSSLKYHGYHIDDDYHPFPERDAVKKMLNL